MKIALGSRQVPLPVGYLEEIQRGTNKPVCSLKRYENATYQSSDRFPIKNKPQILKK